MARKSYTREFKLQALRMITEQGLSVAEAARRLGIRENLLRNWKKAAAKLGVDAFPGHSNLTPEDDELRRLKAEVTRLRAERDLLKKPPRTSPAHRPDVPVHRRQRRRVAGELDVPSPGGVRVWLLRLGHALPLKGPEAARRVGRGDRGDPHRGEATLREPPNDRRVERPWVRVLREHGGRTHASARHPGQSPEAVRPHDRLAAQPAGGREPPGSGLRSGVPERGLEPRTSPTFRRWTVGCTWRWSRICSAG